MNRLVLFGIWAVIVACLPLAALRMLWAVFANPAKAFEQAKAFDLAGNVLLNGKLGEYISTRAYRAWKEGRRWGCVLCKLLDVVDPNHCEKSAKNQQTQANRSPNEPTLRT